MSRLIDADAYCDKLQEEISWHDPNDKLVRILGAIQQDLKDPMATVEPVKKGKWIDKKTFEVYYDVCSECGATKAGLNAAGYPIGASNHFCYNCGADMREDK